MKNIINISLLLLTLLLVMLPVGSANLGVYKQGDCVNIKTILNSTWVNISSISYPNSTLVVSNKAMTKQSLTFNYSFCQTQPIGNYVYDYYDDGGNYYVNNFEITSTGTKINYAVPLFVFLGAFLILALGLWQKNPLFGLIAGMLFIVGGLYTRIYGFEIINNMYTGAVGIVSLGIGLMLSFISIIEMFYEGVEVGEDDED